MFIQECGASRTCYPIKVRERVSEFSQQPYPIDIKATRNALFYDRERNAFYSGINAIRACYGLRYEPNKRAPVGPRAILQIIYLRYKRCVA